MFGGDFGLPPGPRYGRHTSRVVHRPGPPFTLDVASTELELKIVKQVHRWVYRLMSLGHQHWVCTSLGRSAPLPHPSYHAFLDTRGNI